jgi:cell division protein FtsI/penicillin-binding protein 2
MASVAFIAGAIVGASHSGTSADSVADNFVAAWTRRDYATMYSDIDTAAQHATPIASFAEDYERAFSTATAMRISVAGRSSRQPNGEIAVPVHVYTHLFGELRLNFAVKVIEDSGGALRVQWSRALVFPGLRAGEQLTSRTTLPQRATLLARDNSVLAESPTDGSAVAGTSETTRDSPLGSVADAVLGTVGPIPSSRLQALEAEGVPSDSEVGISGVERALDPRLRGKAGGELLAGARLLAYTSPHTAPPVRTSISPSLQSAAVAALGGQLGGVVAMEPASGEVLAVAGLGLNGLQPPGSTFKMVTVTGVLGAGIANRKTVFPYATYATLDGVKLSNAHGEECGGTLELAFAKSCNSVFTPLGVKLGAGKLVQAAELFGFNHPSSIEGAAESTLPAAGALQGELDIGSTAIGQGEVLASPLEMATVAATVADGGHRPSPTFLEGASRAPGKEAMSPTVAHTVRRLMEAVVRYGTGTSAAIPGVTVAGKTGTAELKDACTPPSGSGETTTTTTTTTTSTENCQGTEDEAANTDAWFAAFAPALHPKIVVCVLLVKDGAGGETAAPVARQVIEAALHAGL